MYSVSFLIVGSHAPLPPSLSGQGKAKRNVFLFVITCQKFL